MQNISFYRDDTGLLRARAADKDQLLAAFLETDIQEDTGMISELLKQINAIQKGTRKRYETSGNAHALTLTPKRVTIESLYDNDARPYRRNLTFFKDTLVRWRKKI